MRGWVCRLQLLLDLTSPIIHRFEYRGAHDHILLSQIRDPPIRRTRSRIYTSRNRVVELYPQALGSLLVASYDSQGYGGGIPPRLHTGLIHFSVSFNHYIAACIAVAMQQANKQRYYATRF
jgi:hypothetical protein